MRTYLSVSIVRAEPSRASDGRAGYNVHSPNGVQWIAAGEFEERYRCADRRELQLLNASAGELEVHGISDSAIDRDPECPHRYGPYQIEYDGWRCPVCGNITYSNPHAKG